MFQGLTGRKEYVLVDSSDYWDIKRPLSYNCLYNFFIGPRGTGKTYGSLKYCIEQYLKAKDAGKWWEFVYVRRREEELKKITMMRNGRLFKAVKKEFPDHELKAESNTLYCDGDVMGYAIQLSNADQASKGDSFPNVRVIIFDEFITAKKGTGGYLPDEVRVFNDLYESIARPGTDHPRVIVLFLSNAVSITNPYFDYYHLDKPYNGDIQRFGQDKLILVQNVVCEKVRQAKLETEFYRLNAGSEYVDYAVNNEWLLDNDDFIEKKTQRSKFMFTLQYKGTDIGIWYDHVQWRYYVSLNIDPTNGIRYSVTTDDHKPNVMLFKAAKKLKWLVGLRDAYECGAVYYESMKLKNWFRDIMRMCG